MSSMTKAAPQVTIKRPKTFKQIVIGIILGVAILAALAGIGYIALGMLFTAVLDHTVGDKTPWGEAVKYTQSEYAKIAIPDSWQAISSKKLGDPIDAPESAGYEYVYANPHLTQASPVASAAALAQADVTNILQQAGYKLVTTSGSEGSVESITATNTSANAKVTASFTEDQITIDIQEISFHE